jgi:multiple sugar transport system ATP-binding protein
LQRRLNTTTLYVTHDQVEAMTMGDKIVVLNGGKVEQTGAPLELYDRPANMFVAGFLGSPAMNFIAGAIENDDGPRLRLDDGVAAPLGKAPSGWNKGPVVCGVRPEDIRLDSEGGVPATVVAVEPTGYETHVLLRLGQKEIVAIMRERVAFAPRDVIKISLATPIAHFFDPATGLRLTS